MNYLKTHYYHHRRRPPPPKKFQKAAEDELFEEHERDRKSKCCGIHAPFLAGLFNMIDQPMREINRFFSHDYANGGHSVLQYAKQSGNLRNFKKYVNKVGIEGKEERGEF